MSETKHTRRAFLFSSTAAAAAAVLGQDRRRLPALPYALSVADESPVRLSVSAPQACRPTFDGHVQRVVTDRGSVRT